MPCLFVPARRGSNCTCWKEVFFFFSPSPLSLTLLRRVEVEKAFLVFSTASNPFFGHSPQKHVRPCRPGGPRGLPGRARCLCRARRGALCRSEGRAEVHGWRRRRRSGDGEERSKIEKEKKSSMARRSFLLCSVEASFLFISSLRSHARCRCFISGGRSWKGKGIVTDDARTSRWSSLLSISPKPCLDLDLDLDLLLLLLHQKPKTKISSGASSPRPSSRPITLSTRTASSTRRVTRAGTRARGAPRRSGAPTGPATGSETQTSRG